MKLKGQTLSGPNVEIIVIPRGNGEDIVLHARAILDMTEFEKMCPEPKPSERILPGGKREKNFADPAYKAACAGQEQRRMAWIMITSLDVPENEIEWEKVKKDIPDSWILWETELKDAGFSHIEIQRIQAGVYTANALNETRVQEARANFLRGKAEASENSSGQNTGPNST